MVFADQLIEYAAFSMACAVVGLLAAILLKERVLKK